MNAVNSWNNAAYNAGIEAAESGQERGFCPYSVLLQPELADSWIQGFEDFHQAQNREGLDTPFTKGIRANELGMNLVKNPYRFTDRENYYAWRRGWFHAENERPEPVAPPSETLTTAEGKLQVNAGEGHAIMINIDADKTTADKVREMVAAARGSVVEAASDPAEGFRPFNPQSQPAAAPELAAGGDPRSRDEFCDEAKKTITEGRNNVYGEPEDSFAKIAKGWTWYLQSRGILPENAALDDVAAADMLGLMKVARSTTQAFKADNYTDRVGYDAIAGELASKRQAKKVAAEATIPVDGSEKLL